MEHDSVGQGVDAEKMERDWHLSRLNGSTRSFAETDALWQQSSALMPYNGSYQNVSAGDHQRCRDGENGTPHMPAMQAPYRNNHEYAHWLQEQAGAQQGARSVGKTSSGNVLQSAASYRDLGAYPHLRDETHAAADSMSGLDERSHSFPMDRHDAFDVWTDLSDAKSTVGLHSANIFSVFPASRELSPVSQYKLGMGISSPPKSRRLIRLGLNSLLKIVSIMSVLALTIRVMATLFDEDCERMAFRSLKRNTEGFVLIPSPAHFIHRLAGEWKLEKERHAELRKINPSPHSWVSYWNVEEEAQDVSAPAVAHEAVPPPSLEPIVEAPAELQTSQQLFLEPAPAPPPPELASGPAVLIKTEFGWMDMTPEQQAALREAHGSSEPSSPMNVKALAERGVLKRLIYSKKANMIFCPIPKVANSAWKYLIRKMNGLNDHADIQVVNNRNSSGLTYMDWVSLDDADALLKDPKIMKVVFVRNPYTRAVSGFNNKFVEKSIDSAEYATFVYQLFGYRFFKMQNLTPQEYGRVSFREFVSRVEDQDPAEMNEHWAPQTFLCGMDMLQYDYQGRFESMSEDSSQVLDMLGFRGLSLPKQEEIGFLGTSELASGKSWFDNQLAESLQTKFAPDFAAFSYDKEVPPALGGTVGVGAGEAGSLA